MRFQFFKTLSVLVCLLILSNMSLMASDKILIEKLDDLPRYTYKIDIKAVELFENNEALMNLVSKVKQDLLADLDKYDIQDKTTLKSYYGSLGTIALLEKNYEDYMKYYNLGVELEEKEALKLTYGLFSRAYVQAVQTNDPEFAVALHKFYKAMVNDLPYETIQAELESSKGRAEIISTNLILGVTESRTQKILDQSGGDMSKDIALSLIGSNYTVRQYIPYKNIVLEVLTEYLDAHKVEKPDIWTERDFELNPDKLGKPVVVAIWDSGVDTAIYRGRLFINEKEISGNGVDDDNNGFVDDVNGIAWTLHSEKTAELLYPIGDIEADRPRLQKLSKGLSDISSNVNSEEATELKKSLGSMKQSEVQPFIEDISKYGNYAHGTHVTGIAARGNPFIRIMPCRITFDYKMIPEVPTLEQARLDSVATIETVEYFKKNNVRVVNMSWGGSLADVESALEAHNVGETPEKRKELAREIFEISKQSLYDAINNAPEILFITSAGNADNDVNFEEFIPSSFDLPNIISVGAVDQAGDETGFTSFGKVDVYANGYEVLSYVPGGDEMKMSGTSMSSPNVTNLAAKLFALNPALSPSQVIQLIENGVDDKKAGDRFVKLINPKKSLELLSKMK